MRTSAEQGAGWGTGGSAGLRERTEPHPSARRPTRPLQGSVCCRAVMSVSVSGFLAQLLCLPWFVWSPVAAEMMPKSCPSHLAQLCSVRSAASAENKASWQGFAPLCTSWATATAGARLHTWGRDVIRSWPSEMVDGNAPDEPQQWKLPALDFSRECRHPFWSRQN